MRILILTWLYEPHPTPRAIRWKTVAAELVRMGCVVDVVTSRGPGQPVFEVLSGVNIYRCGGSAASQLAGFAKGTRHPLAGVLRTIHQATWKRLYWPDKACLWAAPAIRTADRLLRQHRHDGMISVSLPFTAHLAGYFLKKRYPDLPWLADVGDPFSCQDASSPNNVRLHGVRNRTWERRVFEAADRVTVTNLAMQEKYAELFPQCGDSLSVIPPVLGLDIAQARALRYTSRNKRLLFLGTLYRNIRNPAYLLALFEQLLKTGAPGYELHLVGDLHDCSDIVASYRDRLGSALVVHGNVPRLEAIRLLAEAAFVVNIGNTTPFQLPSKLVEYAAMGKHIVNLSSDARDSSRLFLKGYPGVLNLTQTADPAPAEGERLRQFLENPPAFESFPIEPWLRQFSAPAVAAAYLEGLGLELELERAA